MAEVMRGGISALMRRGRGTKLPLSLPRGDTVRRQPPTSQEKSLPEADHISTLNFDFQALVVTSTDSGASWPGHAT